MMEQPKKIEGGPSQAENTESISDGLMPLDWQKLLEAYEMIDDDDGDRAAKNRLDLINKFYDLHLQQKLEAGEEISFAIPAVGNLGEIRKFFGDVIREKVNDPNLDDVEIIMGELIGNLLRHGQKGGGNINLKLTPERFYFAVRNKADKLFEKNEAGNLKFAARSAEEQSKIDKINKDIERCFNFSHVEVSERDDSRLEKYIFTTQVGNYYYAGLEQLIVSDKESTEQTEEEREREKLEREEKMLQAIEDHGQGIGLSACLMNKTDEFIIVVERDREGISHWVTMGLNRDRHPDVG